MKELIVSILRDAIERARAAGQLTSEIPSIGIEAPRDSAHGDIASNIALTLAKPERKPPRAIAEIIKSHVTLPAEVSEVSVAGPGFINFKMSPAYWHSEMRRAASAGRAFWKPRAWELRPGAGKKVQVEFLSANPTGPVTVGHGRNAVLGRHDRATLRGGGLRRDARILFQRRRPPDEAARRVGPRALSASSTASTRRCPKTATRASTSSTSRAR